MGEPGQPSRALLIIFPMLSSFFPPHFSLLSHYVFLPLRVIRVIRVKASIK